MLRPRIIPCILVQNKGLVKTVKFKNPKYVGDPINTVRIFNEKEVDEMTKTLSTLIEPITLIFVGGLVGFIALSIITPIYQITQGIGQG